MKNEEELDDNLKPLFPNNATVFFLNTDITVFHTDSVFTSIKDMARRKSDDRLNGNIHTCFKSLPLPWSSEIIDIRFFVNLCAETMTGEFTNNVKSTLCDRRLNSRADISDEISCFCLSYTIRESFFCHLDTTDVTGIFWFTDDESRCSVRKVSLVADTIVYLHDIA